MSPAGPRDVAASFVVARNPEEGSKLGYLIRLPLPDGPLVLKAGDTWPRTAKVYCHPAEGWPDDPEVVETVPVRDCRRRGVAIELVLDRSRENRSQVIFTKLRDGPVRWWRGWSARPWPTWPPGWSTAGANRRPGSRLEHMEAAILEAIDAIRPALQMDGGDIEFVGVVDGVVKVNLTGACDSCSISWLTLKGGVERILKERVPGVVSVEAV